MGPPANRMAPIPGSFPDVKAQRPQEYAARHRREDFEPLKYATPEILTLNLLALMSGSRSGVASRPIGGQEARA